MKLAKFLALSLVSAAFSVGSSGFAQTATTDPVGFTTAPVPVGTSIIVPTLLNSAVFVGNALLSTSANTITPSTNPSWVANAFQPTQFASPTPNYPTHYAEVAEGAYEGYAFDVLSNTSSAIAVAAGDIPVALNNQTVKVIIRPHITLNKLIEGSSNLSAYADAVNIYQGDGGISTRYYDGTSWVAEDFSTPAGHTILYPGTGVAFTANAANASLLLLGPVKTTKTAVYVYSSAKVNLVGPLNPGSSTKIVSPLMSSIATAMQPYADGFNRFSTDGLLTTVGTYYSDGTQLLDGNFNPLPPSATDDIPVNQGIGLTATQDSVWITKSPLNP